MPGLCNSPTRTYAEFSAAGGEPTSEILAGGGELGALMRSHDWSKTVLGPVETWPQSLRTSVSIMLASRFAMVVAWGPDFRFLYNDRYRPVLGASKHPGALGTPAHEIFPEIWHIIGPLFEKAARGEAVAYDDLYLPINRYRYLENCWFTLSYSPIRDESGGVGGLLLVVAETTERVQGERRLRTLRDLAHHAAEAKRPEEACKNAAATLWENTIDVPFALLYLMEADGAIARLASSSGIPTGHQARPPVIDLRVPSSEQSWPMSEVMAARKTRIVADLPLRFGPLPGGPYPENTHTAVMIPMTRPGQKYPDGVLIFGISPRRALDEQYGTFFELAADQILTAIRNALAYQEERERAEKLAELDRAKTAFFNNVSHEFRTPLTLMLGPLEDLLNRGNGSLTPEHREQLLVTHRNSLRLLKLVNSLLDFSRIEAGRVQANYEPMDLASLTSELCGVFRAAIERAGLRLVVDCAPLSEPVYIDHDMWEKIVLNLLSNAFKFTFVGEIEVRLRQLSNSVELRVRDTGVGIAESEMGSLFQRFHRVQSTQGRTFEGTGIGLALVQELVKLHGGSITAQSVLGTGTAFTVTIPLGQEHLPKDRINRNPTSAPTTLKAEAFIEEALRWLPDSEPAGERTHEEVYFPTSQAEGSPGAPHSSFRKALNSKGCVLIADDNADMRDYVRRLLASQYKVVPVSDGEMALRCIRELRPDLVLSDVMMPRLDGFGLLRAIRDDPQLRTIPVILLSARAGEESRVDGLEAGADDYLIKPFSARELSARVESHLKLARMRHELYEREKRVREEVEDQVKALTRLHELSTRLFKTRELQPMLMLILENLIALHHANRGLLSLSDENGKFLHVAASVDFDKAALAQLAQVPAGAGACSRSFAERRRVIIEDTETDPLFEPYRHLAREAGFRSVHSTPILSRDGRALGVLSVHFDAPQRPTPMQVQMADLYARQAADFMEQLRIEQAFRESEARFKALLENSATNIYIKDVQGKYLQVNRWFEQIFRKTQEHVAGKTDFDLFPPVVAQQLRENDLTVLHTGKPLEIEEVAPHLDGPHSYLSIKFPLKQADGRIYAIAGISTDITQRKRDEEAARRLAAIVGSSDDAIVGKDLSGIINTWNKGAERLFGYRADEVVGRSVTIIIPSDRLAEESRILERMRRGERMDHFETVRRRKDGTLIEVSLTVSPIRDGSGTIIGASKIARDITERKRAEQQQQALYELVTTVNRATDLPEIYEAALQAICRSQNATRASILIYDPDNMLRFKAWRGLSEHYRRAVEGHSPWDRYDPDPQPVCLDDVKDVPLDEHLRAVIAKEGIRSLAFIPLTFQNRLLGKFMIYYDSPHHFSPQEVRPAQTIASQVVFAIERHKSSEALEQLVDERTASLREVISQMEEFSYSVSHDLRSPVRAMQGYAQALREDYGERLDAEANNYIERIIQGSSRMERLIRDVLTYSRVSRLEMKLQPVSLDPLIADIVRQYPELNPDKANIFVQPYLPAVLGHEPSLGQVIANLLNNAVKFMAPGKKPCVQISGEQNDKLVTLRVKDNGIGIRSEHQHRIFGMFERIHPEHQYHGTGIGLAIVRRAVERMGGDVGVDSDGVNGSTFWIQLSAATA